MEANFDGLIGPTHFYGGLSTGNVASIANSKNHSTPKAAALQGLAKMKALADLGLVQGLFPPHQRPAIWVLRDLGFTGSDHEVLCQAQTEAPAILSACFSASAMWTANAATVSPSADTADGKVHFTPANLSEKFHRSFESDTTHRILKATFKDPAHFTVHNALPAGQHFRDEGAANHTRLTASHAEPGVEMFVYGASTFTNELVMPKHFPARQTLEACQAIARRHRLSPKHTMFVQQNPAVIDAGAFHNDVISVGNENVMLYHEQAFMDTGQVLHELEEKLQANRFYAIEVPTTAVSIEDAVASYLFNTQLVTLSPGKMIIVAPNECQENHNVHQYLQQVIAADNPIEAVKFFDLHQSMKNGGGPACLRLRVALTPQQQAAVNPGSLLSDTQYQKLVAWVNKHYRDRLTCDDFLDPQFTTEVCTALDELTRLMHLGSIYHFQSA